MAIKQDSNKAKGFIVWGEINHEPSTALSSHADMQSAIAAVPTKKISSLYQDIYDTYSVMNVETLQTIAEWSYHYDCSGAPCFYELKMN